MKKLLFGVGMLICLAWNTTAQNTNTSLPGWITRPLSLTDCLNLALQQNGTILKAGNDLEAHMAWWCKRVPWPCRRCRPPANTRTPTRKRWKSLPLDNPAESKLERGHTNRAIHL